LNIVNKFGCDQPTMQSVNWLITFTICCIAAVCAQDACSSLSTCLMTMEAKARECVAEQPASTDQTKPCEAKANGQQLDESLLKKIEWTRQCIARTPAEPLPEAKQRRCVNLAPMPATTNSRVKRGRNRGNRKQAGTQTNCTRELKQAKAQCRK